MFGKIGEHHLRFLVRAGTREQTYYLPRTFRKWLGENDYESLTHDAIFLKTMMGTSPLSLAIQATSSTTRNRLLALFLAVSFGVAFVSGLAAMVNPGAILEMSNELVSALTGPAYLYGLVAFGLLLYAHYENIEARFNRITNLGLAVVLFPFLLFLVTTGVVSCADSR